MAGITVAARSLWRQAVRMLTGGLEKISGPQRLNILIFHRVVERPDPLYPAIPDVDRFRRIVRLLKRFYRILPLSEALRLLDEKKLPAASAAITFDDGYADNFTLARPILEAEGVSATVFVATKYLDGGCMWNDIITDAVTKTGLSEVEFEFEAGSATSLSNWGEKRAAASKVIRHLRYLNPDEREIAALRISEQLGVSELPNLMMSTREVCQLHTAGFEIGAHTHSHPILTKMDPEVARRDIQMGKRQLESILGKDVTLFAYPNGKPSSDYSAIHVQMAQELRFRAAVSTAPGMHTRSGDPYQIPRVTPWREDALRFLWLMQQNALRTQPAIT